MRTLPLRAGLLFAGILVTALCLAPVVAHAQSREVREAFDKYSELESQGRYEEALPFARKAVELGEKEAGANHPVFATFLNNLAGLHSDLGHYDKAEPLYRRALAIQEKALGQDHPDVGQTLNNLAVLHVDLGRYDEAEPLYHRALTIWEKALLPLRPVLTTWRLSIASKNVMLTPNRYIGARWRSWRRLWGRNIRTSPRA